MGDRGGLTCFTACRPSLQAGFVRKFLQDNRPGGKVDDGSYARPASLPLLPRGGEIAGRGPAGRRGRRAGRGARAGYLRLGRRGRGGPPAGRGAAGTAAGRVARPGSGGVRGGPATCGGGTRRWPAVGSPGWSRPAADKGASKLTPALVARIAGLDAAGQTLRQIAAATGVSTFTVRAALGRVRPGGPPPARAVRQISRTTACRSRASRCRCCRSGAAGRRAELARWGLLGEGAEPVFVPGARYPLAGLLLALPRWRPPACWRPPGRSTAGSRTGSTGWLPRC